MQISRSENHRLLSLILIDLLQLFTSKPGRLLKSKSAYSHAVAYEEDHDLWKIYDKLSTFNLNTQAYRYRYLSAIKQVPWYKIVEIISFGQPFVCMSIEERRLIFEELWCFNLRATICHHLEECHRMVKT